MINAPNHYCTLFDSHYLTRGLAMYESLKKHSKSFHLYIFCFDELSYKILSEMNLEKVTLITLDEFEDEALLSVKETRSAGEYCWTSTPATILHVLKHYHVPACTYLDADLFFYSDPSVLIDEMAEKDILLTEHHYSPQYDKAELFGRFCVQFMTFKNTLNGLTALEWWRNACLTWCFNRVEEGKFGDQKYLDDWPKRFQGVHISQHIGGGIAPWNVQQYKFYSADGILTANKNANSVSSASKPVVFYHFHGLKLYSDYKVDLAQHRLSDNAIHWIYHPYLEQLYKINHLLKNKLENPFSDCFAVFPNLIERYKRRARRCLNILDLSRSSYV